MVRFRWIPIIIDDVKNFENFQMTRCIYFSIESDFPTSQWVSEYDGKRLPLYLLELSGIIYKPLGRNYYFKSVDLINEVFQTIEASDYLYVDTNDIWIPNKLFSQPKRGLVYRVREDLFLKAYKYRVGQMTSEEFWEAFYSEPHKFLSFSKEETIAFQKWADLQINEARELYHKRQDLALKFV
jgi:hypothetical protein